LIKQCIQIFVAVVFVVSCQNENDIDIPKEIQKTEKGIYVLNEGIWGNNNSSISYVGYDSSKIISDITSEKWGGRKLGDTGNSFYEKNDTVYVCVTSSNKIEMFRKSSGEFIRTIIFPQNTEPRNSVISNGKLFVTSFLLASVVVVDLKTFQQTNKIFVGDHPDQVNEKSGKLLVSVSALGSGNKIAIIDAETETKVKDITVGLNPSEILEVPNFILIHCTGSLLIENPRSIYYRLSKTDFSVIDSFVVGKQIFQLGNYGAFKIFAVDDNQISLMNEELNVETTLVSRKQIHSKIIYSALYDSGSGILWIASTDTYTVRGWLEGFKDGSKVYGPFQVGVNPGDLLVK